MTLSGLPLLAACERYFEAAYGVAKIDEVCGVPVFRDAKAHFVGGYKNLYTVVEGDSRPFLDALAPWRPAHQPVHDSFSTERDCFHAKRRHYLLAVPPGAHSGDRLALYRSKTRNQVRKSRELIKDVREGARPPGFHGLYARTMERLGSAPRPLSWFERLEESFDEGIRVIGAYHDGILIGANYFILGEGYSLLLFNVSDERYWHLDVNNRLYDAYIASAMARGIRAIDFGPGMARDASHAHFKLGFGARTQYIAERSYAPALVRAKEFFKHQQMRLSRRLRRMRQS